MEPIETRLELLRIYTNSKNHDDRIEAAKALDLPLELQEILARDEDENVRYWLAMNKTVTDVKLQQILARDEDLHVRCRLAENTSVVNVKIQEILARDEYIGICRSLARNTSVTDRKIWEILRNDESNYVREVINERIEEEKDRIKAEFKEKIKL